MKVRLAKRTGFCFGVKRAVLMAEAALKEKGSIYSLGSLIHNGQVTRVLAAKGLKIAKSESAIKSGTCVISSHGISPLIAKRISDRGVKVIDTTCPFVLRAQRIAKSKSLAGYGVIIVGDAKHPEIKALVGFVSTQAIVVRDGLEARGLKLDPKAKYIVIAQTTQGRANFAEAVKAISAKRTKGLKVFNTICRDAGERQGAAMRLARTVDVIFVVGGRSSANTRRLYEVSKRRAKIAHLIEAEDEVRLSWLKGVSSVGITSGASTPEWVVNKVVKKILEKGAVH
ncbi:MAG: 4-hydroxy-3-methylbut-2-enyl diphosphate reductase [Candidatus Omnitrophica bacterium]|nr:4-hydroxy-3-methylbut-2-enyl diphosphate reductase [Candidatus Omnitrophota bacterium]